MGKIRSYFDLRIRSEITIVLFLFMTVIFNVIIVVAFQGKAAFELLITARVVHIVLAFFCLLAVIHYRKRWSIRIAQIIFSVMIVPLFFIAWINHQAMIESPDPWTPFKGFYIIVLGLTIIAPGGYLLNFFFMIAFVFEIILIWYGLNLADRPNMVFSGEPAYILGTSLTCLLLLYSRYQDEKKLKLLAAEKAKVEIAETLARVLLTIRDQMNTPLQNISLLVHLLRNSPQMTPHKATILENSLQDIIKTNRQFNRLEALVDWEGNSLMSEDEIEAWLSSLDQKKRPD